MTAHSNDGLLYLQQYPRLKKWINQYAVCQRIGHHPDLPDRHRAAKTLISYFPPLPLDEIGLCEQCSNVINRPTYQKTTTEKPPNCNV